MLLRRSRNVGLAVATRRASHVHLEGPELVDHLAAMDADPVVGMCAGCRWPVPAKEKACWKSERAVMLWLSPAGLM
jgi:hypothetical protein